MAKATKIPQSLAAVAPRLWLISVLRVRFEDVMRHSDAVFADSEGKGVHDMRVAIRRLRGAMRDFAQITDHFPLLKVNKRFKRVADALGEVRDQDVALAVLSKAVQDATDEEVEQGLAGMIEEYRTDRAAAFKELKQILSSESLVKLRTHFDDAFDESMCEEDLFGAASIEEAGRLIIGDCLDRFRKHSDCFYHPFALDELHRLRIAAKHLRYAMELFAETFGEKVAGFAAEVADMQGHLGDVHDCDMWIADLSKRLTRVRRKKREMNAERRAAAWLMAEFTRTRNDGYIRALELWSKWEFEDFAKTLERSLSPQPVMPKVA